MRPSVRTAAKWVGVATALAWAAVAAAQGVTIVVNGSGGSLAQVIEKVYEKPFFEETGIRVKATAATDHLGKLKAMMQTRNIEWDATELNAEGYPIAVENGWLEPLDWKFLDPNNELPAEAKPKYGVVAATYSTILAVRTDKLPPGKEMKSWKDFWDVKTFPGPRSLRNDPTRNLEFALLADGVPKENLYKVLSTDEGLNRAFRKLDEIKPHIVTWWEAGAQPVQFLADGEVHYASAWNGRITVLAKKTPVKIVWNGGSLNLSYVVIPKGAKHVKEAHIYIKRTFLDPKRNAEFTAAILYPGFHPGIYKYLPEEVGRELPTYPANVAVQFAFDDEWWSKRQDKIKERWNAWLLK